jgi:hypothetical protein
MRCVFLALLLSIGLVACAAPATPTAGPEPSATVPPTESPMPQPPSATAPPTLTLTAAPRASETPAPSATVIPSPTPDLPAQAILGYLTARAKTDLEATLALSCVAWKPQAATEVTSFRSMNAELKDVTCATSGQAGDFTLVNCGGKMITTYGGESREWDLSAFIYQAVLEDGAWTMCGYH